MTNYYVNCTHLKCDGTEEGGRDSQGLKQTRKAPCRAADPELSQEEWAQCEWVEGI